VVFSSDGNPNVTVNSGTGWTKLNNEQATNGSTVTGAIFWKMASGAAPANDNLTLNTNNTERSSHITYRIRGATGISGTTSNGNSTNSNPPNHAADEASYLWIATRSGDAQVIATAAPSGYSDMITQAGGHNDGASTNAAISILGSPAS